MHVTILYVSKLEAVSVCVCEFIQRGRLSTFSLCYSSCVNFVGQELRASTEERKGRWHLVVNGF